MAHALGTAIVVACFCTGDLLIRTLTSVGVLVLLLMGTFLSTFLQLWERSQLTTLVDGSCLTLQVPKVGPG